MSQLLSGVQALATTEDDDSFSDFTPTFVAPPADVDEDDPCALQPRPYLPWLDDDPNAASTPSTAATPPTGTDTESQIDPRTPEFQDAQDSELTNLINMGTLVPVRTSDG